MKARVCSSCPSRERHSWVLSTKMDVWPCGDGQPSTSSALPAGKVPGRVREGFRAEQRAACRDGSGKGREGSEKGQGGRREGPARKAAASRPPLGYSAAACHGGGRSEPQRAAERRQRLGRLGSDRVPCSDADERFGRHRELASQPDHGEIEQPPPLVPLDLSSSRVFSAPAFLHSLDHARAAESSTRGTASLERLQLYLGCTSAISWHLSSTSRLHLVCISSASRLYLGCISAVSQLCLDQPLERRLQLRPVRPARRRLLGRHRQLTDM